VYPKVSGLNQ